MTNPEDMDQDEHDHWADRVADRDAYVRAGANRHYLGDAVYVEADQRGWVLTTSDGLRDTNTIVLEPETVAAFLQHILKPEAWQALKKADRNAVVGDGG